MMRTCLLLLLCFQNLFTQTEFDLDYYLPNDISYNQNIPTPENIIGHHVGKWHVTHDKLVQYMYALAEASDRITIENRGKTFEDRPLLLLTITSEDNHKNLEIIRKRHLKETDKDGFTSNRPIVIYQGYSIHGNEPSGANAALLVAYYLAAAEGPKIEELLRNTVILLDPSLNPDGLQRFAYWANTNKSQNLNPDSNDREFREVWPGGRTNHYWFDMNRDWLPVQMPESQVRIESYHKWLPNILTDHHEMGTNSTFFFQPGVQSRTHPLTPKLNQTLTKKIGNYHAKALDKIGSLYYSEERFDDFYYGKGSTFPDINGGIGILFEQASSRGHLQESVNGLLSFPFTIKNQFTTTLSTLNAATEMREELLKYQYHFYKNAREEAKKYGNNAIVFGDEKDATKTYHLAEILKRHHIEFYDIKKDFSVENKRYKKNYAYIVPKNQKNIRLINAMFEKRTKFQDSLFYDVSAWSFPLAFNLDHTETTMSNAGNIITDLKFNSGGTDNKSAYAYLVTWHEYYTPKFLNILLKKGVRVKSSQKQFNANDKLYDYGTLMIPVQNQKLSKDELYQLINSTAKACHITVDAVSTGLNNGIDLGSNNFSPVELPKVAVLVGDGIRSYDSGEIWHLLDTRFDMAVTKLDVRNFSRANIGRYNCIILPSTNSGLNSSNTEKLKNWVKNGGTLIAYRDALKYLNTKKILPINFKKSKHIAKGISREQKDNFKGAQVIGGAIFEAEIDRSHPINFGYKNETIPLFRNTTLFVKPNKNSYDNPIRYTKDPLLSGYISKQNLDSLQGTVPLKIGRLEKGKVVAFTDNTNFRAFWYGTNKLLMNAIFFRKDL